MEEDSLVSFFRREASLWRSSGLEGLGQKGGKGRSDGKAQGKGRRCQLAELCGKIPRGPGCSTHDLRNSPMAWEAESVAAMPDKGADRRDAFGDEGRRDASRLGSGCFRETGRYWSGTLKKEDSCLYTEKGKRVRRARGW